MDQNSQDPTAADRANWLAELADAIDQAQKLAWRLGVSEGNHPDAKGLYGQLEEVRVEVDWLRRGFSPKEYLEPDPIWTKLLPWRSAASDDPETPVGESA